tara:strand:- start:9321 stop:9452 length:132 start_codon:yes stop_codon:yes gene_type:complete
MMIFALFQCFEIDFNSEEDLKEKIKKAKIEVAINTTILLFELK